MALARDKINLEDIKRESDADLIVENIMLTTRMLSRFQDKQVKMSDEIEEQKETISKLKDDIQLIEKEKRWDIFWRSSLSDSITRTQISVFVVGVISIIFAYWISR